MSEISGYNDKLYRDALTGVYNRRYFEEKIKTTRFSAGVAMIDLDDFKIYNDTIWPRSRRYGIRYCCTDHKEEYP